MRLEEIKEQTEEAKSFASWFEDEWSRNKGSIDKLISINQKQSESISYLLSLIEIAENALEKSMTLLAAIAGEELPSGATLVHPPKESAQIALQELRNQLRGG